MVSPELDLSCSSRNSMNDSVCALMWMPSGTADAACSLASAFSSGWLQRAVFMTGAHLPSLRGAAQSSVLGAAQAPPGVRRSVLSAPGRAPDLVGTVARVTVECFCAGKLGIAMAFNLAYVSPVSQKPATDTMLLLDLTVRVASRSNTVGELHEQTRRP